MRPHHIVSPNGARFIDRVVCAIAPFIEPRPIGASAFVAAVTQACGLGYRMPPRWGQRNDSVPFNQFGGLGKAYELFGDTLTALLEELNARLAA